MNLCCRLKDVETPVEYIKFIHEKLSRIIHESGMKGLVYHGGPEVECASCGREDVLHCVIYDKATTGGCDDNPSCSYCRRKKYNVNKVLHDEVLQVSACILVIMINH